MNEALGATCQMYPHDIVAYCCVYRLLVLYSKTRKVVSHSQVQLRSHICQRSAVCYCCCCFIVQTLKSVCARYNHEDIVSGSNKKHVFFFPWRKKNLLWLIHWLVTTSRHLFTHWKNITIYTGESAALGRRIPWANHLFLKKYERRNLEFFTWSWENDFVNLYPSWIGKIGFFFFKKNWPHFQETTVIFLFKVYLY